MLCVLIFTTQIRKLPRRQVRRGDKDVLISCFDFDIAGFYLQAQWVIETFNADSPD